MKGKFKRILVTVISLVIQFFSFIVGFMIFIYPIYNDTSIIVAIDLQIFGFLMMLVAFVRITSILEKKKNTQN